MGSPQEQAERMEILRGLIERLSAPDLTLTEAKLLRDHLSDLMELGDGDVRHDPIAPAATLIPSSARGDGSPSRLLVARSFDAGGRLTDFARDALVATRMAESAMDRHRLVSPATNTLRVILHL